MRLFWFTVGSSLIVAASAFVVQPQNRAVQDEPVSVKHESLYKLGDLKIEPDDLRDLPPNPKADGKVIGEGIRSSADEYTFVWKNLEEGLYLVVVMATDTVGIPTWSQPVEFTVRPVEQRKP